MSINTFDVDEHIIAVWYLESDEEDFLAHLRKDASGLYALCRGRRRIGGGNRWVDPQIMRYAAPEGVSVESYIAYMSEYCDDIVKQLKNGKRWELLRGTGPIETFARMYRQQLPLALSL